MDLYLVALSEIALEGLEGVTINCLWDLLDKRQPPIDCSIDQWTKPAIWEDIVSSQHIEFYRIDYNGEKQAEIPQNKKSERVAKKMPPFWINDHRNGNMGYSQSYFFRANITSEIRNDDRSCKLTYIEAVERWGDLMHMVASQGCRQRTLFGTNYPPVIEEVTAPRFIVLEIIGKSRWDGFMQADFQRLFGMDSRTSFHHVKVLMQLHLITKQSVLVKANKNSTALGKIEPPRCSKVIHLRQFSSVFTNQLQRTASKICSILEQATDQTIERNQLKEMCSDIPRFKKVRQWLFHAGYIQYIVNGKIWSNDNINPIQLTHFRASRPCYVNLVKTFDAQDVEDDKDEFLDYIENCDDIEPQLVMEETLHSQAYQILLAVREKGITMKKLAEILCIPHYMARSVIRFFDTNKIGRLISVDYLKQKVQKIVAIQFLHQSDTVKNIQRNKERIEEHKSDIKPIISVKQEEAGEDVKPQVSNIKEMNLKLADNLDLTRVHEKSKISLRPLARKNFILDALRKQPVYEGYNELYKRLVVSEDSTKSITGTCCRKTFRKIVTSLCKEDQLKVINVTIDETCIPPLQTLFICAPHITEESEELKIIINLVKERHENQIRRKEMKFAATKREPGEKSSKRLKRKLPHFNLTESKNVKLETPENASEGELLSPSNKDGEKGNETDTDDEEFTSKGKICGRYRSNFSKFFTYGRFQRLHILHMFLWQLVYGTSDDLEDFEQCAEYMDLIKSQRMWLEHVRGLPTYSQGKGWFNVGDIISLMPLDLTCRILGIKCWSNTAIKFLNDPEKRFTLMTNLPPKLKYKLLVSTANKQHLDNCVDLLVLLAQMGLIAVPPNFYPKVRAEIMLFLRREAVITDTRCSEKGYCHVRLPPNMSEFPKTKYQFRTLKDLKSYWEDLQFICLNTPLGLSRATRTPVKIPDEMNEEEISLGKAGINQTSNSKGLGRNYRSFTILRDFQSYYERKDFTNMEPNVFGNGLGAGGMDSIFFAHLVKNWRTIDTKSKKRSVKKETDGAKSSKDTAAGQVNDVTKKIVVSNSLIKKKKGGKGLKRTHLASKIVVTKKMKMDRKKKFDQLIAKRFENIREKIKQREIKRKTLRKSKRMQQAMNHDETDREALRLMKGLRVSFTEREDAYILLADIVRTTMNLSAKGQPLEKEHPKILWRAIRDILHKDIPESKDKTWNAINRRARYIKKYPHSLIVYKTCMAELGQNKEFMNSIKCNRENWKEMLGHFFNATREIYSRHFNQPVTLEDFPESLESLDRDYTIEYADKENEETGNLTTERTEKNIRIATLRDLMHNAMIAQRSPSYKPSLAFKLFDMYCEDEMRAAFDHFKKNRLVSRLRCDLPRSRSLPVTTMTYTLSAQTYDRIFDPPMPIKVFNAARSIYLQLRDGKKHTGKCKEQDLSRLPYVNYQGCLDLDYSEIQGGHLAFIVSAILTKKVVLNFTLKDEMIIADEAHMKKLQKGTLHFQRVAFEQRVRKGRKIKRLTGQTVPKELTGGEEDDLLLTDEPPIIMKDDEGVVIDDQRPCCSKSLDKNPPFEAEVEVEDRSGVLEKQKACLRVKSPPASVENTLAQLEEIKNSQSSTRIGNGQKKLVSGDQKKRKVSFNQKTFIQNTKPMRGTFEEYFGTRNGLINGFYSRLANSDHETIEFTAPTPQFKRSKTFGYTSIEKRTSKSNVPVDIFKESKLFASRTSLAMHRSLNFERLDPMNAMNTHDALVINPMGLRLNALISPFRSSFHKPKHKQSEDEEEMWKRIKASGDFNDVTLNRLLPNEYEVILRDDLKFNDALIQEHVKLLAFLKTHGTLGLTIEEVKEKAKKSYSLFFEDFDLNLQTLINFEMAYKVGHDEALLVHSLYILAWTFRAPQALSLVETKGTTKKTSDHIVTPQEINTKIQELKTTPIKSVESDKTTHVETKEFNQPVVAVTPETDNLIDGEKIESDNAGKQLQSEKMPITEISDSVNPIIIPSKYETLITTTADSSDLQKTEEMVKLSSHENPNTIQALESSSEDLKSSQKSNISDDPVCSTTKTVNSEATRVSETSMNKPSIEVSTVQENPLIKDENLTKTKEKTKEEEINIQCNYRNMKVFPWLKMNGELNGVLLRRLQENVLVHILLHPGIKKKDIIKHFQLVLFPEATIVLLKFLELNKSVTKHYLVKKKTSLFGSVTPPVESSSQDEEVVYYLPTVTTILNMTDTNR